MGRSLTEKLRFQNQSLETYCKFRRGTTGRGKAGGGMCPEQEEIRAEVGTKWAHWREVDECPIP